MFENIDFVHAMIWTDSQMNEAKRRKQSEITCEGVGLWANWFNQELIIIYSQVIDMWLMG